jgi:hypothetical protein
LAFDLLKRSNGNEQGLDGADFLVRCSSREILMWSFRRPLAPVEIAMVEQQGSMRKQWKQTPARANNKADRRNDRDRLALREFQFPE